MNTNGINIQDLANDMGFEPHHIAATLDLGTDWNNDTELTAEQEQIIRFTDEAGVYHEQQAPRVVEVHGGKFAVQFHTGPDTWGFGNLKPFDTREQAQAAIAHLA